LIKKLKSSLTAKIFILTALLLAVCCIATYALIAKMIPEVYSSQIDMENAEYLAYETAQELQQTNTEGRADVIQLFQEISKEQYNGDLELHFFDSNGYEVSLADISDQTGSNLSDYDIGKRTNESSFSFADSEEQYTMFYFNNSHAVNYATEAIERVFPYLLVTILIISIVAAFIYSKYITAPIKRINEDSEKMAELDFDVKCGTDRTDELGSLSNNLNFLSTKLSATLGELESANAQLIVDIEREKQLERQRTELFASVSHELKTPITIAKGQLQGMIYEIGRYKNRDTYLVQSLDSINSLEKMVQELLAISRIESPDYVCKNEILDLTSLIKQCLTAQEDLFIQKDMKLESSLTLNILYSGDQQLIKRVFDNLITNALAYSPPGNTILVILSETGDNIEFSIENTGVQIDDNDLSKIFEAFYRTEQSRNRQTGGSGLGLYITKKALDLHKAEYHINNTGNGVIFTIVF